MRTPARIAIAALLLVAVFWIKSHLDLIPVRWQNLRDSFPNQVEELKGAQTSGKPNNNGVHRIDSARNASSADSSIAPTPTASTQTISTATALTAQQTVRPVDGVIVVAKLKEEDTDWVVNELPEWQNAIYVVDDPGAPLHPKKNKGRESNVYLQYIIDNYDRLPSTIVFLHSHRDGYPRAWHTDAADYSNVNSVRLLQIDFVQRNGYANLRCNFIPGCPDEIQPFRNPRDEGRTTEHAMLDAWPILFNNSDIPEVIATPCCSQFAVSRARVRERPLSHYVWFHKWIMETELTDDVSGRVMEYLWHIIFGQDPVYCPELRQCYHDVYGFPL